MIMTAPPRLYLLDTLRGLASLSVIIWHYQHFFFVAPGTLAPGFEIASQPFYALLAPFYAHGYLAVQLFFSLSGFVFFLMYFDVLSARQMGAREFFVLRFSRLYPLHFVTLLLVVLGQYLSWRASGTFIVYPFNDLWHFALNIFFASDWGLQKGFSFNSPVWSVSVEVLIYALFFAFARFIVPRLGGRVMPVAIAIGAAAIAQKTLPVMELRTVASGAVCFFLGGFVFLIWEATRKQPSSQKGALAATAAIVCLASIWVYVTLTHNEVIFRLVTFPSAILVLALMQDFFPVAGKSTRLIGDITYSTYLIHFPIQLGVLLAIKQWGLAVDFTSQLVFCSFLAAVLLLAVPVYYRFELPMQKWLRGRLLAR
jgi:peptidoglycan/LPS O-acetylase OafA/YrhL